MSQIVSILIAIVISNIVQIIDSTIIPNGYVVINFDYTQPEEMEVKIPYYIENPGISDLTDIIISIKIKLNYTHNSTKSSVISEIFYKEEKIRDCKAMNNLYGSFEGYFSDFNLNALIDFFEHVYIADGFWIISDIKIKGYYFLGLIKFAIILDNLII